MTYKNTKRGTQDPGPRTQDEQRSVRCETQDPKPKTRNSHKSAMPLVEKPVKLTRYDLEKLAWLVSYEHSDNRDNAVVKLVQAHKNGKNLMPVLATTLKCFDLETWRLSNDNKRALERIVIGYLGEKRTAARTRKIIEKHISGLVYWEGAIDLLGNALESKKTAKLAIVALANCAAEGERSDARNKCMRILEIAIERGKDVTPVLPLLLDIVKEDAIQDILDSGISLLQKLAEKGIDITPAIPGLLDSLRYGHSDFGKNAMRLLVYLTQNPENGLQIKEQLLETWKAETHFYNIFWFLNELAENGIDISNEVKACIPLIIKPDHKFAEPRFDQLKNWAQNGGKKIRAEITAGILRTTQTDWFMQELAQNNKSYIFLITQFAVIMDAAKMAEVREEDAINQAATGNNL